MIQVNGYNVRLVSAKPARQANGWLQVSLVYLVRDIWDMEGVPAGLACSVNTRKNGEGEELSHWIVLDPRYAKGQAKCIPNGTLSDLVAAAVLASEGYEPFAPPVED